MRNSRLSPGSRGPYKAGQHGQALAEGIIVMVCLLALWMAISWLGKLQDMALQADHASRHAAFSLTRQSQADLHGHSLLSPYLYTSEHRWNDSAGQSPWENGGLHAEWMVDRNRRLPVTGQIGGDDYRAARLRQDWRLHDEGIHRSKVTVVPRSGHTERQSNTWWSFVLEYPIVTRSTSILAGAGHAVDDSHAQAVMGDSDLAWRRNADYSRRISDSINDVMQAVDQGWRRVAPAADWLEPWADLVPVPIERAGSLKVFGEAP